MRELQGTKLICSQYDSVSRHICLFVEVQIILQLYVLICLKFSNYYEKTSCKTSIDLKKKWFRLIAVIKNHIKFSLLPECFVLQVLVPLNVLVRSVNISFFDLGSLKFLRNFRYHYFHYCNCQSYRVVLMIFISKTVRIKR